MKISREWATPLTIGTFGLMATTGTLMFFHLESGLNKTAHEWLGWFMIAGGMAHATVHWGSFKRYFASVSNGRKILTASALVLAASFFSLPGKQGEHLPPPVLALKAVTGAPLTSVAQLAGKPADKVMADLSSAGIVVADPNANLASVLAGDHEKEARAINIIFSVK